MRKLLSDLIPHAPQHGLYVAPSVPSEKLRNALQDYGEGVDEADVLALYDATLMGSAKDGALFTTDRLLVQNNDLEPVHEIRYEDIVSVESRRKLIGGRRVKLKVNRGRATFDLEIDFSGKPDAAEYVARFLKEAMLRDPEAAPTATDIEAVRASLQRLVQNGQLSSKDMEAMMHLISGR